MSLCFAHANHHAPIDFVCARLCMLSHYFTILFLCFLQYHFVNSFHLDKYTSMCRKLPLIHRACVCFNSNFFKSRRGQNFKRLQIKFMGFYVNKHDEIAFFSFAVFVMICVHRTQRLNHLNSIKSARESDSIKKEERMCEAASMILDLCV